MTVPISAILKHVRVSKRVVVVVVVVVVVFVVVVVVVVVVVGETRCDLRQVEEVKKVETKHGGGGDQGLSQIYIIHTSNINIIFRGWWKTPEKRRVL